jgi:hypothetical protein
MITEYIREETLSYQVITQLVNRIFQQESTSPASLGDLLLSLRAKMTDDTFRETFGMWFSLFSVVCVQCSLTLLFLFFHSFNLMLLMHVLCLHTIRCSSCKLWAVTSPCILCEHV